ncbi:uncharacterized protein E0L32_008879 [Thyridium curvatum]|uniref:Nephrocystin 3-like N-terminal domain-containing protein n=1 Tax=Thyridium curvatum TaxID=1093900 RepID=A0A507AQZ3_9PEZI|nr:uncharacterized protein E0L32_008879 [Thyridium curvatum]TPX09857.1 hypothetical protein E0L32_008879 [Thyridium curvatum]
MEVLGAAASVAGLISLAIEIPKIIDTAISMKSAPEEAGQLSRTVDALVTVLQRLEEFLKSDAAQDLEMAGDSGLTLTISACQDRVVDLSKKLRKQSLAGTTSSTCPATKRVKTALSKFQWPLDKKECLDLISQLHIMQSTFEFCLVIKNCEQMSKSHKEVLAYFKSQRDALNQLAQLFPDQAAHAESMLERLNAVQSCMSLSAERLSRIQVGLDEMHEMETAQLYGQALEWLSPIDPSVKHHEILADKISGTCKWIETDSRFQKWATSTNDVVCWVGDPGQGKTYTMSHVVEYLKNLVKSKPKTYVTYLYCDYKRTANFSATALFGALVRQLLPQLNALPSDAARFMREAKVRLGRPTARLDEIRTVLEFLRSSVSKLYVCIDALDECNEDEGLVDACGKIPFPTSFCFIGRSSIVHTVRRTFPKVRGYAIRTQTDDIRAFVASRVEADRAHQPDLMPKSLEDEILKEIPSLANGMFLLVSLHTSLVLSHNTIYRRRQALRNQPSTLDDAFGQTFARIKEHVHTEQALKILAWIHYSGTLWMEELRHVLAIEPEHRRFENDNLGSSSTILDCCLGLVRLNRRLILGRNNYSRVALAHETLSVYLDSHRHILASIVPVLAHTCLTYFSFQICDRLPLIYQVVTEGLFRFLQTSKHISSDLEEKVWKYCVNLNIQLNSCAPGEYLLGIPEHVSKFLHFVPNSLGGKRIKEPARQSLIHTACMLGIDTLDPILDRLSQAVYTAAEHPINEMDCAGITPLGWTLISRKYKTYYALMGIGPSFVDCSSLSLWRAERLIRSFPALDCSRALWNGAALDIIHGCTHAEATRDICRSRFPFPCFLYNYPSSPQEAHGCLSVMTRDPRWNVWTCLQPPRAGIRLPVNRLDVDFGDSQVWALLFLRPDERHTRKTSEFETRAFLFDALGSSQQGYLSRAEVLIALFEPGGTAPVMVTSDRASAVKTEAHFDYPDIRERSLTTVPEWEGRVLFIPQRLLLCVCAVIGSSTLTNHLLSQSISQINSPDRFGRTALDLAFREGSEDVIHALLSCPGVDLININNARVSALHNCAHFRMTCLAAKFLEHYRIDVNLQDSLGRTALHLAAEARSRAIVRLLLKHGADVLVQDYQGNTALHAAIKAGDTVICDIMLESRSSNNISASNAQLAWKLALESGAKFTMKLLDALRNTPQRYLESGKSLSLSTLNQQAGPMKFFLARSDMTEKDLEFMIQLDRTAAADRTRQTTVTSSENSDTTALDFSNHRSIIKDALMKGAVNVANYMIRQHPDDLNHIGEDGESALHLAVIHDAPKVVQFLLGLSDCDLDEPDPEGYTAPQLAIRYKRLEILETLLTSGKVSMRQVDRSGATLLILAIRQRFPDAVPLLLTCDDVLVNHIDESGRAALHYAVTQQDIATVKHLLACPQLDPAVLSRDGRTALAFAAPCASTGMISILLGTNSIELGHQDEYGKTAHDWARLNSCREVIEALWLPE